MHVPVVRQHCTQIEGFAFSQINGFDKGRPLIIRAGVLDRIFHINDIVKQHEPPPSDIATMHFG